MFKVLKFHYEHFLLTMLGAHEQQKLLVGNGEFVHHLSEVSNNLNTGNLYF